MFPQLNLITFLTHYGYLKFQLFDCDPQSLQFRVGSRTRQWFTVMACVNGSSYFAYQVYRLYTVPHVSISIEQVSLDVVWIMGTFTSACHSFHSLVYHDHVTHFISSFLQFAVNFEGWWTFFKSVT